MASMIPARPERNQKTRGGRRRGGGCIQHAVGDGQRARDGERQASHGCAAPAAQAGPPLGGAPAESSTLCSALARTHTPSPSSDGPAGCGATAAARREAPRTQHSSATPTAPAPSPASMPPGRTASSPPQSLLACRRPEKRTREGLTKGLSEHEGKKKKTWHRNSLWRVVGRARCSPSCAPRAS